MRLEVNCSMCNASLTFKEDGSTWRGEASVAINVEPCPHCMEILNDEIAKLEEKVEELEADLKGRFDVQQ